ncbi:hypothetical protein DFP73DRAFT_262233 [Morchella snyderi]|nr:hypothetical protein DFP73DRAFT_262233 [Morchella snyderi]
MHGSISVVAYLCLWGVFGGARSCTLHSARSAQHSLSYTQHSTRSLIHTHATHTQHPLAHTALTHQPLARRVTQLRILQRVSVSCDSATHPAACEREL